MQHLPLSGDLKVCLSLLLCLGMIKIQSGPLLKIQSFYLKICLLLQLLDTFMINTMAKC